jgi:hypothetical protein
MELPLSLRYERCGLGHRACQSTIDGSPGHQSDPIDGGLVAPDSGSRDRHGPTSLQRGRRSHVRRWGKLECAG